MNQITRAIGRLGSGVTVAVLFAVASACGTLGAVDDRVASAAQDPSTISLDATPVEGSPEQAAIDLGRGPRSGAADALPSRQIDAAGDNWISADSHYGVAGRAANAKSPAVCVPLGGDLICLVP